MAILVVAICFLGMKPVTNYGDLELNFSNYVGDKVLMLDSTYQNELGQDFTITNFKYYVGNFRLVASDGQVYTYTTNRYHLVKADDPKSWRFVLPSIPDGNYILIEFTLGVDSIDNCSGAQSGALDPANAMFWAWNTGYVFLKLEGKSSFSRSPGNILEYHIGGYKQPNNCIRKVRLHLKDSPVKTGRESSSLLQIKADAAEVLKTPMTVDFSKLSSVTDSHHATEFADNYADMFSVLKVENDR